MPVTTNDLRSLTATRYVDNTAQEIDAADLRAGMTLMADVIDDSVNAIAIAASFGFPLYETVEAAIAVVKPGKGFSIVEEDGVAIYKNSEGAAEKLQTLLATSAVSTLTSDVENIKSNFRYTKANLTALLEDTSITYSTIGVGDLVQAGTLVYRVLAADADLYDLENEGGVRFAVADDTISATALGAPDSPDPVGRTPFSGALVQSAQQRRLNGVTLRGLLGERYNGNPARGTAYDGSVAINGFLPELVADGIGVRDDDHLVVSCETAIIAPAGLKMALSAGTRMVKRSEGGRLLQRDKSRDFRDTGATLNGVANGSLVVTSAALAGAASPPVIGDKLLIRRCSDGKYYLQGLIAPIASVSGNNFTLDYRLNETISGVTCHATLFAWADDLDISGGIWGAFDDATKHGHAVELFGSHMSLSRMQVIGHYSGGGAGGLAMLLAGDNSMLHAIRTRTPANAAGTGAIRVVGGRGWRNSHLNVACGDDGIQFVQNSNPTHIEYDWDILDSIYSDSVAHSAFARAAIIALGGPQDRYDMMGRMHGVTMRGISGSGTNRSIAVENSEGIGYSGQVDNVLLDDINIDARNEPDELTAQSISVYSRIDGGIGRVGMRKVVTKGTRREHGLTIQAPGAYIKLEDCVMEGQGAGLEITSARRVDIVGGAYGTVDRGGSKSANHVIDATAASNDVEINISGTPMLYGVATGKAGVRLSSASAVLRSGDIRVERRAEATGVIGVSTNPGCKADLGMILGDFDTATSGGGFVAGRGVGSTSAANFAIATHAVNTFDKYVNKIAINTTDGKAYRATGPLPTDPWTALDGSGSITPI